MFESAELGHKIDKKTYDQEEPGLRADLLDAQYDLAQDRRFKVLIIVAGVDGAGKGETVNLLNEWMDPRHIHVQAFGEPSDEEAERPRMWRFWRGLPPRGKIGVYFGSWYTQPILDRVAKKTGQGALTRSIDEIVRMERMLSDEGTLVLKFWFHLSRDAQKQRLKALEKDPDTAWRVTAQDWWRFERYERYRKVSEYTLRESSTAFAPWIVVEGSDARYRNLTVGKIILEALKKRLAVKDQPPRKLSVPQLPPPIDKLHVLRALDLGKSVTRKAYDKQVARLQGRLSLLTRHPKFRKTAVVGVFEGPDAGGKGGAIRRITWALDARAYRVIPIAAPTEEELAQPYLWRFWRQLPRRGRVAIFDRSWYGRVLVERVEGFAGETDWMRAYSEINDFEEQMVDSGMVVAKFWLAISKEEQLRRFKEREKVRFKRFKITDEDWRNRKKWEAYETAVCDMVDRTSTGIAPWTLVEANDKLHARIKVLATLGDALEARLEKS